MSPETLSETTPTAPSWRVASASVRGTSHVKTGQPCQDSVYHCVTSGGALIAAVADGAGSAALSDIGSSLAARESVEAARVSMLHTSADISESYLKATAKASVLIARSRIESEAHRCGRRVRDLATTLLLVIHARGILAAAQIGDGAVVVSGKSAVYSLFTTPQRGEYANETVFLISRNALDSIQLKAETTDVARVAMFTDGIQNLVLDSATGTPHAPFFAPVFQWLESQLDGADDTSALERLLTSPRVTQRTDDDLTLLLASASGAV